MPDVLVLGNAGLDLGLRLPHLPRPGESLTSAAAARAPGGKGLNQATVAARAGARVRFHAPLGAGPEGDEVARLLGAEPFAALALPRVAHPTDFSVLIALPDGENAVIGAGPCAAALPPGEAAAFAAGAAPGDLLLLQGNLGREATAAALRAGAGRGARTVLNPSPLWWDPAPLLPLCGVVVANRIEAEALTGESEPRAVLGGLRAAGVALAVVTLGAEGCVLTDAAGTRSFPAEPVDAVDTTGCGDAFCGVLVAMLSLGRTADEAVAAAQRAAALTATRPGAWAALPSRDELRGLLG